MQQQCRQAHRETKRETHFHTLTHYRSLGAARGTQIHKDLLFENINSYFN